MSIITGFCMFFLSFFPLWMSVLFIDIKSIYDGNINLWTEVVSVSLIVFFTIISIIVLLCEFNPRNANNKQGYILVSVKEEKTITAEYLLSYILPLFSFDFTVWNEVILFLIFFAIFAFLSIRHNYFLVNVLLELMQYKFYSCELKNEDGVSIRKIVVCKKTLSAQVGGVISIRAINNEYVVMLLDV